MKYIRHIISLTIFLTISFFCYQLYKMQAEEMKKLNKQVEKIFWQAIQRDADLRLDELNIPWIRVITNDFENSNSPFKTGGGTLRSKNGDEFIPYSNIERPPQHLEGLYMDQSYLSDKNPLSAVRLDSMFKECLKDLLPDAATLVYYCNRTKDTVEYSARDTVLTKSRIASPWINIGMSHELLLRAYVGYPTKYVSKEVWLEAYPFLFVVLILLGILMYFFYKMKKTPAPVVLQNNPEIGKTEFQRPANSGRSVGVQPFYFRGKKIVSTNQNLVIFKLFLSKPERVLEHQEIICALWGNKLFDYNQRLRKCMQRFREFLSEEFPESELISIKGKGYRLHFPYEENSPVTASASEPGEHPV